MKRTLESGAVAPSIRRRAVAGALLLLLLLLPPIAFAPASAQSGAVLKREDPQTGTRVWQVERPGAPAAFRATTVVDVRLSALAALLLDGSRMPDWVYRVRETVRLRSDGPSRGVTLVVTAMPFPLLDREAVVAWEMTQDPRTLVVTMAGQQAAQEIVPPHADRVRMPVIESRWVFSPRADGRVDVLFEGAGDPGGNLSWPVLRNVVAALSWEAPWQTILALREIVRDPAFAQARVSFIREPEK